MCKEGPISQQMSQTYGTMAVETVKLKTRSLTKAILYPHKGRKRRSMR